METQVKALRVGDDVVCKEDDEFKDGTIVRIIKVAGSPDYVEIYNPDEDKFKAKSENDVDRRGGPHWFESFQKRVAQKESNECPYCHRCLSCVGEDN